MSTHSIRKNRREADGKLVRPANGPLLLNGDHLSVPEFERRYEAMQDDRKAELIEGIAIMSPPISSEHGKANSILGVLLGQYAAATPRVACAVNASLRLDGRNEYQPDVLLWIESGSLARTKVGADGLLEGRPELVAEVALSSHAFDLNEKKAVYQRNQIQEYIVWEVMDARLQWFALQHGEYVSLAPRRALRGLVVCSRVFPGLWLDLTSLVVGKGFDKGLFRTLNKGLKNAEHKSFVKKLAKS
jgi:Uma2 family endonuclease